MSAGALLPCRGVVKSEWVPTVQQTAPETLSGNTDVLELGRSHWTAEFEFDLSRRSYFDDVAVFLAERDGADLTFTSPRHFRKFPADTSISSDAGVTVSAVNIASRTVTFGGVGTGKATAGDMISFRTVGNGYWTGLVRADATPVAGVVTMSVWPAPVAAHSVTPSPRRIEALAEFRIVGEPKWNEQARRRGVSFTARQVIR
jgi:hypothetical protein